MRKKNPQDLANVSQMGSKRKSRTIQDYPTRRFLINKYTQNIKPFFNLFIHSWYGRYRYGFDVLITHYTICSFNLSFSLVGHFVCLFGLFIPFNLKWACTVVQRSTKYEFQMLQKIKYLKLNDRIDISYM